jgi:gamma-glutamylcyclotransferase (GGCT)/AIG2-like uncharacterized protein YtfP
MKDKVKVAVYGTLRKHFGNHRLLAESDFLGSEWIDKGFKMVSLGGFPGLVEDEEGQKVLIEVYEINQDTLISCNMLEGYRGEGQSNFYDRKTIETSHGEAFIYYLGQGYAGNPPVESGDWLDYYSKKQKRF